MTRLTVHECAGVLRPRYRAAKKGAKRAGLETASLKVSNRITWLPQIGTDGELDFDGLESVLHL